MSRHAAFRQADLTRALRAAKDAGADPTRVEIDRAGKIVIVLAGRRPAQPEAKPNRYRAAVEAEDGEENFDAN